MGTGPVTCSVYQFMEMQLQTVVVLPVFHMFVSVGKLRSTRLVCNKIVPMLKKTILTWLDKCESVGVWMGKK